MSKPIGGKERSPNKPVNPARLSFWRIWFFAQDVESHKSPPVAPLRIVRHGTDLALIGIRQFPQAKNRRMPFKTGMDHWKGGLLRKPDRAKAGYWIRIAAKGGHQEAMMMAKLHGVDF